jgi:RNA polymerase sigma factor (sigma-70 family)
MATPQAEPILRHIRTLLSADDRVTDADLLERFIRDRDEAAFTALYRRYARLVWSVCRRVLHSQQDMEDAFQATFFLFARKANTIRRSGSVGSWLYGVAWRTAMKAKKNAVKREARERGHLARIISGQDGRAPGAAVLPPAEVMSRELQALLDAEIMRLPEKYRAPFVLCCLETRSKADAASELGWKEGTVSSRLARARRLLARRLSERGVELSVVLGTLAVSEEAAKVAQAAIPSAFRMATIKAALAYASGSQIASPVVAGLIQQMGGGIKMSLLKTTTAFLLATTLVAGGAGAMVYLHAQPDQPNSASATADKSTQPAINGKVAGQVILAEDEQPVSGAEVRLIRRGQYSGPPPSRRTTTNAQGKFTFDNVAAGEYRVLCFHGNLASRTKMYQGDIAVVEKNRDSKPVVLKLQPGVAVRVKVLCQATGKPIEGARVRLVWTDIDRDHFTDAQGEVLLQPLTAETYHVQATAEHCAAEVRIMNLANEQPAALQMKLPPGASVQGIVKDENGRPVSGVAINLYLPDNRSENSDYAKSDAQGRYRFDYLPLGKNLRLDIRKPDYLTQQKEFILDAKGGSLTQLDLAVKKRPHGGSVQGVVTDGHGKPIAGAEVVNNGNSSDEFRKTKTSLDGKFSIDNVYDNGNGLHELIVKASDFSPRRFEFKPGPAARPAEVIIGLDPGHRIKGRVINEAGKPISGVQVYFAHGNSGEGIGFGGSATTDAHGRFHFDSMPADTPFTFVAEGYSQIPEIKLPLDGDQEVDVQMRSQGIIKGRVVDSATGKPVPRFTVRITHSLEHQPGDPTFGIASTRIFPGENSVSTKGEFLLKDLIVGFPLQVSIIADGYRRQAIRRIVAQSASEAETVDIRITAQDPAKLTTIRGKLLSHKGQPVYGAELRLIVATDRAAQRDAFPFNWQMIETGQIEQIANVLQFQHQTTAADGSFVFERVPGDAEIELAYWGKGIPPGRQDHLETLSAKERASLEIKTLAPARLVGTIDRKIFPEIGPIQLSASPPGGSARFFEAKISADGKSFDVDDLPPGQYEVQIYSLSKRVPDNPGAFQQSVIARRSVTLKPGKIEKIELGKDDLAPAPVAPPPAVPLTP